MAVSSLRDRLTKLQGKTRNVTSKQAKPAAKREKKSFFDPDNSSVEECSLIEGSGAHLLRGLNFPGVQFDQRVTKSVLFDVGKRLSTGYLFPQISNGPSSLSQNSKTSRISRQYPRIFMQDQLYSLFPGQETAVDKSVTQLVQDGVLRLLNMNLDHFGFRILMLESEYQHTVTSSFSESEVDECKRFLELVRSDPSSTKLLNMSILEHNLDIPKLINKGLICISTEENMAGIYNLTVPHLGGLLRVIKAAIKWITGITVQTREKMILDSTLREKWFKPIDTKPDSKSPNAFNREHFTSTRVGVASETTKHVPTGPGVNIVKFRAVGLDWILSMIIGMGIIEAYDSPVGVVYKATGKSI